MKQTDYKHTYNCYLSGSKLTDQEIVDSEKHFLKLSNMLYELGPEFRIAAAELNRVYKFFYSVKIARKI